MALAGKKMFTLECKATDFVQVKSILDMINDEKRIDKLDLRQASSNEGILNSKIFTQYAQNAVGQYFLRFATAVKGDLQNVVT